MANFSKFRGIFILAGLLFMSACAKEKTPASTTNVGSTYTAPTSGTTTPTTSTTTTSSTTYTAGTTSTSGGTWSSSTSSVTCPADMTSVPQTSEQRSFCIDKNQSGSMGFPANYYWADRICQGIDSNTTQNAGKHLCYMSEVKSACGQSTISPIAGWVKWVPTAVDYNVVSGFISGGTQCSQSFSIAASNVYAFYCCK